MSRRLVPHGPHPEPAVAAERSAVMTRMRASGPLAAVVCGLLALPRAAEASPLRLVLDARNTSVSITSGTLFGKVPARFGRLSGELDYDPAEQTCRLRMTMVVRSLVLDSAVMRVFVMSEGFLDPDAFPTVTVAGSCRPEIVAGRAAVSLVGTMTMRGQTRPVTFMARNLFEGRLLTAIIGTGTIDRRNWGVGGVMGTVEPAMRVETRIDLAQSQAASG